ncbi:MAG: UDP-2,3-diacylglucosamine diphosphatase [Chthoniobacterales bacterium]
MKSYRSCWISDFHLGTKGCQAPLLLDFIRDLDCETLYLVGDILDIWALKRGIYWPQTHNDVIQKLLRKGRKGTKIIYIPGNHDEFVSDFPGDYASVHIQKNAIHECADGRRILVIHGHELDIVVQNLGWLAHLGDIGYKLLLRLNFINNALRRLLGLRAWSLSAFVKSEVKNVVGFIGKFEESIARYAEDYEVDGVICGHIHTPAIRKLKNITYYNTGDWVEHSTALLENHDGSIDLLDFSKQNTTPASAKLLQ